MDSQGHDIQSPGAGRTVEGLAGRRILLGITGSIAAYKAAVLCRLLKCAGAEVRVVMTPLAKQFITPLTMATLSKTRFSWNSSTRKTERGIRTSRSASGPTVT